MTKYGRPAGGRPGVEHLGDVRVVHQGQGLPLGLEPGDHLPGVHPRLDHLQGHLPADRLGLLGHEHQPMPPSPICSSSLYGPIDRSPGGPLRSAAGRRRSRPGPRRRSSRKLPARKWATASCSDPASRGPGRPRTPVQVRGPVGRPRQLERVGEDRLQAGRCGHGRPSLRGWPHRPVRVPEAEMAHESENHSPALGRRTAPHTARPGRTAQSRLAVAGEMPRAGGRLLERSARRSTGA